MQKIVLKYKPDEDHFVIVNFFFFVGKLEKHMILGDQVYTWLRISSETVQAYVQSNYPVSLTQLQIKIGFEFSYIVYSAVLLHSQPLIYASFLHSHFAHMVASQVQILLYWVVAKKTFIKR